MKKIKIDFENCYGIRALQAEFDFSKKKANIIYAPNGSMKTSFALTFKDLADGKDPQDRIYKTRQSKRVITDEDGTELSKEQIFVIEPYVSSYPDNGSESAKNGGKIHAATHRQHSRKPVPALFISPAIRNKAE